MQQTRTFLRDLWRLTKPYWYSEERWQARGLLAAIVALNLGLVYLDVLFNQWNNAFYNSLESKDMAEFFRLIWRFTGLAAIFIVAAVYQLYLNQMLQIRWRRWLTDHYLNDWIAGRTYYQLQLAGGNTDNPDQRIADDLAQFVDRTLNLTLGFMSAVVTLFSFLVILWALSGAASLVIGNTSIAIPGYMVWVALVYAVVGTWIMHRIGRPLVELNFTQQKVEADFRFSLVRFRENAEGIALHHGEQGEIRSLTGRFTAVADNWWAIMRRQKKMTWFSSGYGQIAIIFPFVVAAPRYFAGQIKLGDLMQTASAFGKVQGALSWFVSAYTQLAAWKATVDRLTTFQAAMARTRETHSAIAVSSGSGERVALEGLTLALPNGATLLSAASLSLEPHTATLITGASGSGKSTLFRALAGIWPFGAGTVRLPAGKRLMFLPQKPYLIIGTLREQLCYPGTPETVSDEALNDALNDVGLSALAPRLNEHQNWAQQLSGGEQQRIAFARALLQKPDWLFLDEATAAMDEAAEARLYGLLHEKLANTTVVSIGHRQSLVGLHQRRIEVLHENGVGRLQMQD